MSTVWCYETVSVIFSDMISTATLLRGSLSWVLRAVFMVLAQFMQLMFETWME